MSHGAWVELKSVTISKTLCRSSRTADGTNVALPDVAGRGGRAVGERLDARGRGAGVAVVHVGVKVLNREDPADDLVMV